MSDENSESFSDEQARAILARAIELDARAPLTTTDQLRLIASEISISPTSLEAALKEQTNTLHGPNADVSNHAARRIAALGIPIGLTAGWLVASGFGIGMLGLQGVALVVSGSLAVYESTTASLRSFHLRNFALWGSAFVGSVASAAILSQGFEWSPTLVAAGWCVRNLIVSGILGSATMIAVRRSRRSERGGPDAPAPEANDLSTRNRVGILQRILDGIGRSVRFPDKLRAPAV